MVFVPQGAPCAARRRREGTILAVLQWEFYLIFLFIWNSS